MSPIAATVLEPRAPAGDGDTSVVGAPAHCEQAVEEMRIQEELIEADAVLADEDWKWVRELADKMHDEAAKIQSKLFFLRLLRAQDSTEMDAVLGDMEMWRTALSESSGKNAIGNEEREGIQALFLLGLDKQMSLARCP